MFERAVFWLFFHIDISHEHKSRWSLYLLIRSHAPFKASFSRARQVYVCSVVQ